MTGEDIQKFDTLFKKWARRVRARMAFRQALTGAALGLLLGALASCALWRTRHGSFRPHMAAFGGVGLLAGLGFAVRRRWSDQHVALYLDGRLDSAEAITTALGMRATPDDPASTVVITQATEALARGDRKRVRPRVFSPDHVFIPLGVAAIVMVARLPVPALAIAAPPPGTDTVQLAELEGLEKIAALESLNTPDEAQRQRLKKLADDAKKLREKLREGMERREALSEIAKLRDDIAAERMTLGDGERRAGLEAAQGRLAKEPLMKDAAKALGDRDLTRFDEDMQKLANSLEERDREKARKALAEAAEEARKNGAPDVARALEEQKKLFDPRSERGKALKELAEAFGNDLPPDLGQELKDLENHGTDKDARKFAEKMADALKNLTPEERKKLGQKLREQAEKGDMSPMTREQMRDMAKKLDSAEGQKDLEEYLRKMANEPTDSAEAERERRLDDAQRGAGEAERGLGAAPMPMPMPGQGQGQGGGQKGQAGNGKGEGKSGGNEKGQSGEGGPGSHHDTGRGDHKGNSSDVDSKGFRSRAGGRINSGAPMPGVVSGRAAGRAGDSANIRGQGALGEVGPGEVSGADRSDIPEEYREQIGRYFSP